jgi:uncharacterized protein DUF6069
MQNTDTQDTRRAGNERIAWGRLPWVALLAALLAAVTNALVYVVASGLGTISQSVLLPSPSGESPLTVGLVVTTSVIGTVGAALVFAIIGLLARRPTRLFRIVATVALVLSFLPPATVPGVPPSMKLSLALMHVVAWAASVGLLTTLARQKAGGER